MIPKNIFGNCVSSDVCKGCNERFGNLTDCELPRDRRVLEAAKEAGVDQRELLKRARGVQRAAGGRRFHGTMEDGRYRMTPSLKDLSALVVGAQDGQINRTDLKNLKRRWIEKLRGKFGGELSVDQRSRADALINALKENPDKEIKDPVLLEGFRPVPVSSSIELQVYNRPLCTDLSVAKMLLEAHMALMPEPFLGFLRPVQECLRTFVKSGLKLELGQEIADPLQCGSEGHANLQHFLAITATQRSYESEVRLFGSARWHFAPSFHPHKVPSQKGYRIEIVNPFGRAGAVSSVRVIGL